MTFQWHGDEISKRIVAARERALTRGSEHILEHANRTVPIEEGTLMRSGATDVDAIGGRATVSYDTPYARRQHEDMGNRHDAGRRAKWLELTMNERAHDVFAFMAREIASAL